MTESILVGILSALSALAGTFITQFFESRRRLSEERRWYAEFFLSRKVDALQNLYTALDECYYSLNFYGNVPPKTLAEHREQVQMKVEAYLKAKSVASLYLDDEAREILAKALGRFRQASTAIFLSLPDDECPANKNSYDDDIKNLDWLAFNKAYEDAAQCLQRMLNPSVLQQIDVKMLNPSKKRQIADSND